MDNFYTWQEVCTWNNLPYKEHGNYAVSCPICAQAGKTEPKLYLCADNRSFYCQRCGSKGGVVDLYALFHNVSFDEAKQQMRACRKGSGDYFAKSVFTPVTLPSSEDEGTPIQSVGIKQKDIVYEAMVNYLHLNFADRCLLRKRGLTDKQIDEFRFRSLPCGQKERKEMVTALEDLGLNLLGIPGFYQAESGEVKFVAYENGILIPLLGVSGKIQGFQIRSTRANAKSKYFALSSGSKEKGCKSETFVHCVNISADTEAVYLTEGALKADVASALSCRPFMAVLGVKCLKHLPKYLKSYPNLKRVYVAYDMDRYENPNVMAAQNELVAMLHRLNIEAVVVKWDKTYKGIDDFLLSKR